MHKEFPDWLVSAQSIAIVGNGREGKSTVAFLSQYFPEKRVFIFENHQETFDVPAVDVLFKSPGIPKKKVHFDPSTYVTSQSDLFVQMFGAQTIAITGTKGKSTTAHAINHIFTSLGHASLLIGNIGKPVLDYVDQMDEDTTAVFEMSAFQTESLHSSVHIAVFTSLYQDHLDYYDTMDEYIRAKKHLFDLQTSDDLCLYRDDYPMIVKVLEDCVAKKLPYNSKSVDIQVNYIPAVMLARALGASEKQINTALESIQPLPGRLEKIGEHKGILFYDDALATIPEATINALDTLGDDVCVLIAGGHERNQDFTQLAKRISRSKISTVILFPPTGERLASEINKVAPNVETLLVDSMEEAVKNSYEAARSTLSSVSSPIVLLSAASPSFGLFKDYTDRSRQYTHWVHSI